MNLYLELAVFAVVSFAVPAGILLFSFLIRPKSPKNDVLTENYESAEEPIGSEHTTMKEYFYYFLVFLSFEFISIIMLLWSVNVDKIGKIGNAFIVALPVIWLFLVWLLIGIARHR